MSRGINKVIIVGNVGRDPEVRYTANGSAVANFSVATSESWNDKTTGERKEQTEWHRITCFGRLAEIAGEYLRKGSKVYIEGSLRTREWEKDGQTHRTTEINAREIQMLGERANSANAEPDKPTQAQPQANPTTPGQRTRQPAPAPSPQVDFDDDIPF